MDARSKRRDAGALERVRKQFEDWRRRRTSRSAIPEGWWAAAVGAARQCGVHRTAAALRLDYYRLKHRVEAVDASSATSPSPASATFVELAPGASRGPECEVELENADGGKMRMRLQGATPSDLAALVRSFGDARS